MSTSATVETGSSATGVPSKGASVVTVSPEVATTARTSPVCSACTVMALMLLAGNESDPAPPLIGRKSLATAVLGTARTLRRTTQPAPCRPNP